MTDYYTDREMRPRQHGKTWGIALDAIDSIIRSDGKQHVIMICSNDDMRNRMKDMIDKVLTDAKITGEGRSLVVSCINFVLPSEVSKQLVSEMEIGDPNEEQTTESGFGVDDLRKWK